MNITPDVQEILKQTRGVFKYRTTSTSKNYSDYSSSKYETVQVGFLDLENNIVFNSVKNTLPELSQHSIIRYKLGFYVRQYRSCEDYIPDLVECNKEIREVMSSRVINQRVSSSSESSIYSTVGFLNNDDQLIYYDQIITNKDN